MQYPLRQNHILIQVNYAERLPLSDADISSGTDVYCTLSVGPQRMSTAALRVERMTATSLHVVSPDPPTSTATHTHRPISTEIARTSSLSSEASSAGGGSLVTSPPSNTQVLSPTSSVTGKVSGAPARAAISPISLPQNHVVWGDHFLLREDDMTVSNMTMAFEVVAAKRWPVPDASLAVAELEVSDLLLEGLMEGREALLKLPLWVPDKQQQQRFQLQKSATSSFASAVAAAAAAAAGGGSGGTGAAAPAGVLVVTMKLQPTCLNEALSQQLPVDLMPTVTLDAHHLAPGSVVHSPAAHMYVEPCVVYLRVRLLGVEGLKFTPPAIPACNKSKAESSAVIAAGSQGLTGPPSATSVDLVLGFHEEGSKPRGLGVNNEGKAAVESSRLSDQMQEWGNQFQKGKSELMKAGESLAKQWGFSWKGFATSSITPQQPAPSPQLDSGKELTAVQSQSSAGLIATAEASPESHAAAAAAAMAARVKAAGSSSTIPRGSAAEDTKPFVSTHVSHTAPVASDTAGRVAISCAGTIAAASHQVHKKHKKSVDFDVLMNVLETNGFSYTDRGIFSYFWCKLEYEGQEHTSRMVQQDQGVVVWGGTESIVLAAVRPVGQAPLLVSLYGSRDKKSRGKPVCQVSLPFDDLLAAAGLPAGSTSRDRQQEVPVSTASQVETDDETASSTGTTIHQSCQEEGQCKATEGCHCGSLKDERGGMARHLEMMKGCLKGVKEKATATLKSLVPGKPSYDPQLWPRGDIVIKGKLEEGGSIEVSLEVTAVDSDDRAAAWGLPLLKQKQAPMTLSSWPATATGAAAAAAGAASDTKHINITWMPCRGGTPAAATWVPVEFPTASSSPSSLLPPNLAPDGPPMQQQQQHASSPCTLSKPTSVSPDADPLLCTSMSGQTEPAASSTAVTSVVETSALTHEPDQATVICGKPSSGPYLPLSSSNAACTSPPSVENQALAVQQAQPLLAGHGHVGLLHFILHSVEFDTIEYSKPLDSFFLLKCGNVWVCSCPCPPSRSPSWDVHCKLPMRRPTDILSLSLYKRTELGGLGGKQGIQSLADIGGKKGASNVRTVMGIMGISGGSFLGKLRLRLSTLVPGRLHTVELPLQGERLLSRSGPTAGKATVSLMLDIPLWTPLLMSYIRPQLYPPVQIMSMGCVAGDDMQDPFLGDPILEVDEEVLERRAVRAVLSWLEQDCSPGVSSRVAKKLLDDGRQEFTLSRTKQNWRRLVAVLATLKPLMRWWNVVRSWRNPTLSSCVVICVVLWAMFPSRGTVIALIALSATLLWLRGNYQSADKLGIPLSMVEDLPADAEDPPQQQQLVPGASGLPVVGEQEVAVTATAGGTASSSSSSSYFHSRSQPSLASTLVVPAGSRGSRDQQVTSSASYYGSPTSPPSGGATTVAVSGGAASKLTAMISGAASSVVPLDTFDNLKSQYDGVVGFLSLVQNVLDNIATALERIQALLTWQDPTATALLVAAILVLALAIWLLGLPGVLAAAVLFDIIPPPFRDPLPAPPLVFFRNLPSRSDRMM